MLTMKIKNNRSYSTIRLKSKKSINKKPTILNMIGFSFIFDARLLQAAATDNIALSPFTLLYEKAGSAFAASIMNAVILTAIRDRIPEKRRKDAVLCIEHLLHFREF